MSVSRPEVRRSSAKPRTTGAGRLLVARGELAPRGLLAGVAVSVVGVRGFQELWPRIPVDAELRGVLLGRDTGAGAERGVVTTRGAVSCGTEREGAGGV